MIKITNPKISKSFYDALSKETLYILEPRGFCPTYIFLSKLINKKDEYTELPSTWLKKTFGNYKVNYRLFVELLQTKNIIDVNRYYSVGEMCRKYKLTNLGHVLMLDNNTEYLKNLHKNSDFYRRNQKNVSKIRNKDTKYAKYIFQYQHDLLTHLEYDYEEVLCEVESRNLTIEQKNSLFHSLINLKTANLHELMNNNTDNRIWNEVVGMKSDFRFLMSYKELQYNYTIDITSCHPLYLSHYLLYNYKNTDFIPPCTSNNIIPNTSSTTNLHYDGLNGDILQNEHRKWVEMYTNETLDIKQRLVNEGIYKNKDTAKKALNETINGCLTYKPFVRWFAAEFPNLYEIWNKCDKTKVGTELSSLYETKLMQDEELYKLAEQLEIKLSYEYDGVGVFCRDSDYNITTKLLKIKEYIQSKSLQKFQIKCPIKIKDKNGEIVNI